MTLFNPCQGKSACRDDGTRCLTCGRDLQEIERLRGLLDQLASLAMDYDYENVEAYAGYISRKLIKTIRYRRDSQQAS
jgi:hypothetical protein